MAKQIRGLTAKEAKEVVQLYQVKVGNRRKYTQGQLASKFFVSAVTIRRALADAGLVKLASHKSPEETAMIDFLRKQEIYTLEDLEGYFDE